MRKVVTEMADAEKREKVIRGLEAHANPKTCETCAGEDCPYYNEGGSNTEVTCSSILAADALALLKEQEGVKPIGGYGCYICGACRNPLNSVSQKFCANCGKAVKWE